MVTCAEIGITELDTGTAVDFGDLEHPRAEHTLGVLEEHAEEGACVGDRG